MSVLNRVLKKLVLGHCQNGQDVFQRAKTTGAQLTGGSALSVTLGYPLFIRHSTRNFKITPGHSFAPPLCLTLVAALLSLARSDFARLGVASSANVTDIAESFA